MTPPEQTDTGSDQGGNTQDADAPPQLRPLAPPFIPSSSQQISTPMPTYYPFPPFPVQSVPSEYSQFPMQQGIPPPYFTFPYPPPPMPYPVPSTPNTAQGYGNPTVPTAEATQGTSGSQSSDTPPSGKC